MRTCIIHGNEDWGSELCNLLLHLVTMATEDLANGKFTHQSCLSCDSKYCHMFHCSTEAEMEGALKRYSIEVTISVATFLQ